MTLVEQALSGDVRAAAKLMRDLDDELPSAVEQLRHLYDATGRAYVIGVTGSPGSGKSTMVDALIARYRKEGLRVGVVAVDPTSPISGGAILGDRIRMQRHAADEGVFIRSVATRGTHGGLSRSTGDIVTVLDALRYDRILIETVGVGQDEMAVVAHAHAVVVVTVPGLGDEVQALKAGVLEIADILVVNKADRDGAERAAHDLESTLALRGTEPKTPVFLTVAITGQGIDALWDHIEERLPITRDEPARRAARARSQVMDILRERVDKECAVLLSVNIVEDVVARRLDPYAAADLLFRTLAERLAKS